MAWLAWHGEAWVALFLLSQSLANGAGRYQFFLSEFLMKDINLIARQKQDWLMRV
jgi:hypothetical protein